MSFGDVLISFEIEMSISEDDDSRQTIHHRSVIENFLCNVCVTYYVNVFIHSLLCLKVRVQLYRPINYWFVLFAFIHFPHQFSI